MKAVADKDKSPQETAQTPGPGAAQELPTQVSRAVSDAMRDQKKRQERLRHVQEFLTSPNFIDMKDQPLLTASDATELSERRRDLKYRINVMESVVGLLIEELDLLDRVIADQSKPAALASVPEPAEESDAEPQA